MTSTALMKMALPDTRTQAEILASAKKIYDGAKAAARQAGETLENIVEDTRRGIALEFALAHKLYGTSKAQMARDTGIPYTTVNMLCEWGLKGRKGTPYGPQRKLARIRQLECLIVDAIPPEMPDAPPLVPVSANIVAVAPHEDISRSHETVSRKRDDSEKTVAEQQKLGKRVEKKIAGVRKLLGTARKLFDDESGFEEFKRKYCPSLGKVGLVPDVVHMHYPVRPAARRQDKLLGFNNTKLKPKPKTGKKKS